MERRERVVGTIPVRTTTAFLVLALAGAGAFGLAYGTGVHEVLLLPTSLGGVLPGDGSTAASSLEGVTVSPASISFGALRPSKDGAAVEIRVQNGGAVPVQVRLAPSALVETRTGATIAADAIQVVQGPSGSVPIAPGTLVAPGGATSLWVRLAMPSGATQWVPAGAYAGTVAVHLQEASP